jgi:DNA-binding HxlR family transcriptional regulator
MTGFERGNVLSSRCPSREVVRHMTSRWGLLILMALEAGPMRFAELRRTVDGISERMLAQTLANLEGDGLLLRTDYHEVPPRVDYRLTDMGRDATGHVLGLMSWIETNLPQILEHREKSSA